MKKYICSIIGRILCLILIFFWLGCGEISKKKPEEEKFRQKAEELFKNGKFQEALIEYKKILEKKPQDTRAIFQIGVCYQRLGNLQAAKREFQKVLSFSPQSEEAETIRREYSSVLQITEEQPTLPEEKLVQGLLKGKMPGEPLLPKFTKERKSDAYNYYLLGVRNSRKGKWNLAIAQLEKAIQLDPDYAPTYTELGIAYAKKGIFDKAISTLKTAVEKDPDNIIAHYNLGAIYEGKGLWSLAINSYMKVLTLDPNNVEVRTRLGLCFVENNQNAAAMDQWNIAVTIDPNYKEAHLLLGKIYSDVGEAKFVRVTYTLEYNPESHTLNYVRSTEESAERGLQKEYLFFDAAINEYEKVLDIDPLSAEAHYGLGTTYARAAQKNIRVYYTDNKVHRDPYDGRVIDKMTIDEMLKKAAFHLKQAVRLDPENPFYRVNLGVVYGELGFYDRAEEHLKKAVSLDPRLTAAYANLAVIYSYRGAIPQARATYKKIAKIDPNKVRTQESLKLLQPEVTTKTQVYPFKPGIPLTSPTTVYPGTTMVPPGAMEGKPTGEQATPPLVQPTQVPK